MPKQRRRRVRHVQAGCEHSAVSLELTGENARNSFGVAVVLLGQDSRVWHIRNCFGLVGLRRLPDADEVPEVTSPASSHPRSESRFVGSGRYTHVAHFSPTLLRVATYVTAITQTYFGMT
jgi:hypothetical protein